MSRMEALWRLPACSRRAVAALIAGARQPMIEDARLRLSFGDLSGGGLLVVSVLGWGELVAEWLL